MFGLSRKLKGLLVAAALVLTALPAFAQTIVYGRGNDALTLDPAMATSSEDFKTADWTFDGLVRFEGPTTKIVPALAESWETSEDGKAWTFHLRQGVKFHDGTPFTAEAVKVSFERQFKQDHPSYSPRFVRWANKYGAMTEVEVVDDHTAVLHFSSPQPALLYNLAIYPAFIASPTAIADNPEGMMEHPVGTGPFKFVRWEKNNFIELERNDEYWGEVPKVERVVVRVIPENDVRLLALQKGEIHLTDDVPFNRIADLQAGGTVEVQTVGSIGFSATYMNMEREAMKDVRVRKAIQMAINRERIFRVGFFGQGIAADQPMPPGEVGHSESITKYAYDPEAAKALLAEAGYPNGLSIEFLGFSNPRPFLPAPTDTIAMIQADLAAVGVKANVSMATWADWISRRRAGDFDLSIGGWTSSTVDPEGVIYALFHSRFVGADNFVRMAIPEMDKILEEAIATTDEERRADLYVQAADMITEEAPVVFLAHPVFSLGVNSQVKGVFRNPANQVYLNAATVE